MYVCPYVCMSVCNGFTIELHGFMHSLRTFWHVPLRMPSYDGMEIEVKGLEHRRRCQNESRCMEDGYLLNKRMKDDKITVTKNDLRVNHPSNLLRPMTRERVGGGQHSVVLP